MNRIYRHLSLLDDHGDEVAHVPMARGESAFHALERGGRAPRNKCGGHASCGQCWVRVEEGAEDLPPPSIDEAQMLARFAPDEPDLRLACKLRLPPGRRRLAVSGPSLGLPADPADPDAPSADADAAEADVPGAKACPEPVPA